LPSFLSDQCIQRPRVFSGHSFSAATILYLTFLSVDLLGGFPSPWL
jgi:hypothetical protein